MIKRIIITSSYCNTWQMALMCTDTCTCILHTCRCCSYISEWINEKCVHLVYSVKARWNTNTCVSRFAWAKQTWKFVPMQKLLMLYVLHGDYDSVYICTVSCTMRCLVCHFFLYKTNTKSCMICGDISSLTHKRLSAVLNARLPAVWVSNSHSPLSWTSWRHLNNEARIAASEI